MAEEGTQVTIRMGLEEIQKMEDFMADNDIGNRSDFIREAISSYIADQKVKAAGGSEGGIFVHLTDEQLGILKGIEMDGTCSISAEEFARKCITDVIVPAEIQQEVIMRAVRASQMAKNLK
mgnify:CR=1 FL=1